ncbi:MAG: hypothetical protein WDW36_000704 [Sanguina aurantia]
MAAHADSQPHARVRELERQLAQVKLERDELRNDIEALCLKEGSSIFDRSYVMSERVASSGVELKELRERVLALEAERSGMQDDVLQLRDAKHIIDKTCQIQAQRLTILEKDITFFQRQAQQALADRDQSGYDAEQLKEAGTSLELALKELQGRYEVEVAQRREADRKGATARNQIQALQLQLDSAAEGAGEAAGLRRALGAAEDAAKRLEQALTRLKASPMHRAQSQLDLDQAQTEGAQASALLRQAHKIEDQLSGQIRDHQATAAAAGQRESLLKAEVAALKQAEKTLAASASSTPPTPSLPKANPPPARRMTHGDITTGGTTLPMWQQALLQPQASSTPSASPKPTPTPGGTQIHTSQTPPTAAAAAAAESSAPSRSTAAGEIRMQLSGTSSQPPAAAANARGGRLSSASSAPAVAIMAAAEAAEAEAAAAAAPPAQPGGGLGGCGDVNSGAGCGVGGEMDLQSLRAALDQARAETRVERGHVAQANAQLLAASTEALSDDERERLDILTVMVKEMKIKLAQATQEKVEALLRMAAASAAAPAPGSARSRISGDSHSGGGARRDSGGREGLSGWLSGVGGGSQRPAPTPSPVQRLAEDESPASPGAVAAAAAAAAAAATLAEELAAQSAVVLALRGRLEALGRVAEDAQRYTHQLTSNAKVLWANGEPPARRWGAITALSALQDQLGAAKRALGCNPDISAHVLLQARARSSSSGGGGAVGGQGPASSDLGGGGGSWAAGGSGGIGGVSPTPAGWHLPQWGTAPAARRVPGGGGSPGVGGGSGGGGMSHGGGGGGGAVGTVVGGLDVGGALEAELSLHVLDLVEFGVQALEQHNRQAAHFSSQA